MSSLVLHQRQFVIAREIKGYGDDWKSLPLPDGFVLNYQKELEVMPIATQDGRLHVLGYFFDTRRNSPDYTALPAEAAAADIQRHCSGRFVVLEWPRIRSDASCYLGVYYRTDADGTSCSSSAALMAQRHSLERYRRKLSWSYGMDWFPLPGSPVPGVNKVFPDQILDMRTGKVSHDPNRTYFNLNVVDPTSVLCEGLVNAVSRISRRFGRVYLALTGGLDSRVLFGALLASGVKFECTTSQVYAVPRSDVTIAQDLCKEFGIKHTAMSAGPFNPEYQDIWRRHTLSSYGSADEKYHYPGNTFRYQEYGDVLLRGTGFELGRRYFASRLHELDIQEAAGELVLSIFERRLLPTLPWEQYLVDILDEWLTWRRQYPVGLDFVDTFYLDQRMAGWLSSGEQAFDLTPAPSINPAVCFALYEAMMSEPEESRKIGALRTNALKAFDPRLLVQPVNPINLQTKVARTIGLAHRWTRRRIYDYRLGRRPKRVR